MITYATVIRRWLFILSVMDIQEIKQFVIDNHKSMTCAEMAKELNTSIPRIYYHLTKFGLLDEVKRYRISVLNRNQSNPMESMEDGYFDVDSIGSERTWLI